MISGTRLVFSIPSYGILALAGVLSLFMSRRVKASPSLACMIVSAIFFTYILVRAAHSPIDYLWWQDFYMVIGCLLVYLLTAFYITSPRDRGIVLIALLAMAVLHVFIGLRQFAVGDSWMPFGFLRATGVGYGRRASGLFVSPIHLAGYLEAVGVFALSFAFWSTWKAWARFLSGYVAVLCYVGVAVTGSRGGYLSVAFSLLVFTVLCLAAYRKTRPRRFPRMLAVTCAALVLTLGGAVALMSQSDFLQQRLSMLATQLDEKNRDIRIYNWQAAIDQFKVSPTFGTGAGTHIHYGRLFRRPQLQADPIHAHSDYLELLAEYGIVGGIGMVAFLLVHIGSGFKGFGIVLKNELRDLSDYEPARSNTLALQIGALSAVAAYLVHSISDFNLHIPGNALLFAFIFGILAAPLPTVRAGWSGTLAGLFRFALPAVAIYFAVTGLPKFYSEYFAEKSRVALRNFDLDQAIAFGQAALERETQNPFIYFHTGGAHLGNALLAPDLATGVREYEAAAASYLDALSIFPQDEHTLIRLAQALTGLGKFKEAEQAYLKAIQLDPNLGAMHVHYAAFLADLGRHGEAVERLARGRALSGNSDDQILHGGLLDPRVPAE